MKASELTRDEIMELLVELAAIADDKGQQFAFMNLAAEFAIPHPNGVKSD